MFASPTPLPARPELNQDLVARVRPLAAASSRRLPLLSALHPLLGDGIQRGSSTVVVAPRGGGGSTLGLTLLTAASSAGHWCGVVGLHDPGVMAMADLGVDLRRVVFVAAEGGRSIEVAGELTDGVDLVLLALRSPAPYAAARQLLARVRDRRAALVVVTTVERHWPIGGDVEIRVSDSTWTGPEHGHGCLTGRRATVLVGGRRMGGAPRRHTLWLPTAEGEIALMEGA